MHLPALVKNYVPNAKFIKVDFPEDYGPITQTTNTLSFLLESITSLMNSPLNSKFSPSINSKQSFFLKRASILYAILDFSIFELYF